MNTLESIKTKKGNYSIYQENDRKYFLKELFSDIVPEIEGYNMIKFYYNVPKLISYDLIGNKILYEYDEGLKNRTLHQALFNDVDFNMDKMVQLLTFRFKDYEFKNENLSVNSKFFIGRIKEIINYLDLEDNLFDMEIYAMGHELGKFRDIVKEVIAGISENNIVPFVTSQGDPTDLNISTDYMVSDFEVAGKNSIINEVAIFIGCYIVNCYYYYIKYMKSPHAKLVDTLNKYKDFVHCKYKIENNKIFVDFKNIIPANVKKFILKYLEKVKSLGIINPNFNLGSYVALRFISPVNLGEIESEEDKILLMTLCCLFQKKIKKLNQIIKFIKEL